MSTNHTPTTNPHRQAHNRSVSAGTDPSCTNIRASASPLRPVTSSLFPKTWEYNNQPADKLPEDVKSAWRRDRPRKQASVAALRHGYENPSIATSPRSQPRVARLGLSKIQTITVSPIQETPPSSYHEAPPKDQSSYEYAITDLLARSDHTNERRVTEVDHYDLLLSELKACTDNAVHPMPPLPDDQISYVGSDIPDEDEDEDVPEDGIPAHLKKHDAYKTKMRLIQLRTLLMRCQVLQSTMNNIERKPWTISIGHQPYTYYSKMRKIAYRARELAERLESRELQARCEYWTGRGHGGTQDFEAAAEHFALAMKLDVRNDTFPSGRPKLRGLRPNEKEDVRFLFDYALQREKEWRRRTEDVREATRAPEEISLPYDESLEWSNLSKPAWLPERDRIMGDVKLPQFVSNTETTRPEFSNKSFQSQQLQLEAMHNAELRRRHLSGAEKSYIQHDHKRQAQRQDSTEQTGIKHTPETSANQSCRPMQSRSPSLTSPTTLASYASLKRLLNLEDELGGLEEWCNMTPSSSGSFRVCTPESELQRRRNVHIGSINTSDLEQRMSVGEATHGEDPEA